MQKGRERLERLFDRAAERIGRILFYEMLILKDEKARMEGNYVKVDDIDKLFE